MDISKNVLNYFDKGFLQAVRIQDSSIFSLKYIHFISLLIWYNSKKCNKKGNKTFIALFFILNWQTKHSTSRFTLMINILLSLFC